MPPSRPTVTICLTLYAYGDLRADTFPNHMELITSIVAQRHPVQWFTIREDALISRSRCRATRQFIDSDCDVWLQLDHDLGGWTPQDLFDLCHHAHTSGSPVQIPYSKRGLPPAPAHRPHPQAPLPGPGTDALTQILMFASGCVAIPRRALDTTLAVCRSLPAGHPLRVQDPYDSWLDATMPTLWHPAVLPTGTDPVTDTERLEYLSEDYSASARFIVANIPLLAFSRPTLLHYGIHGYSLAAPPATPPAGPQPSPSDPSQSPEDAPGTIFIPHPSSGSQPPPLSAG